MKSESSDILLLERTRSPGILPLTKHALNLVRNAAGCDVEGCRGHGTGQVRGGEGSHIADIVERLHPLEHARVNEAFGNGFAPVLAGSFGHAAAVEGHDADAVRPELHGQLAQDVDPTEGARKALEVDLDN